jgi:gamma-glutamyltranspeptidase
LFLLLFFSFGSVVRSPQLGIVWNNHMDDFSVPGLANGTFGFAPSRANFIEPGKRPMSSMSPLVVYDRESRKVGCQNFIYRIIFTNFQVKMAIGASGGPKIPSAVAQVLSQVLSFNHSLKLAIDTPRLHNQFTPFDTHYEAGFPQVKQLLLSNILDFMLNIMPM